MTTPLPTGSTIGIIGGGQLGRMLAMAAARLAYRTVILEPQPDCPAAQIANRHDPGVLGALALDLSSNPSLEGGEGSRFAVWGGLLNLQKQVEPL